MHSPVVWGTCLKTGSVAITSTSITCYKEKVDEFIGLKPCQAGSKNLCGANRLLCIARSALDTITCDGKPLGRNSHKWGKLVLLDIGLVSKPTTLTLISILFYIVGCTTERLLSFRKKLISSKRIQLQPLVETLCTVESGVVQLPRQWTLLYSYRTCCQFTSPW